jgi:hypothetical protein
LQAAAPPSPDKIRFKTKVGKKPAFDARSFPDSVGVGRNVHKFRGKESVFPQADSGHYLSPFAKTLLALAALREKKTEVERGECSVFRAGQQFVRQSHLPHADSASFT